MKPILVIDDDTPLREVIADALRSGGYAVDEARNGLEGIQKARANRYSLFVVDISSARLTSATASDLIPRSLILVVTSD